MKKRTWLGTGAALGLAFMGAVAIDYNGYNIFDRADGSNAACDIDPHCRNLTQGEIALAQTIFGDTIDYKHVKVFTRGLLLWKKPKDVAARMWNGNLYMYKEYMHKPDLSVQEGARPAEVYLHEMTHVWQYKNDPKFLATGFFNLLLHDFVYNSLYRYEINEHRDFAGFNFEQQGDIIGDYYRLRTAFRAKTKDLPMQYPRDYKRQFNVQTRAECQKLDQYATVISASLPQMLEVKCAMYRPYVIAPIDPGMEDVALAPAPVPEVPVPTLPEESKFSLKNLDFLGLFDVQPRP